MGTPKGGGYTKQASLTKTGEQTLEELLRSALSGLREENADLANNPLYQQAVQGTQQFLPGGGGGQAIQNEALRNFQQSTIPSILNSFGQGAKSSSALNQALAGAGQNLNSSIASQLAQMQLQASGQAANLAGMPYGQALQGAQLGLGTSPFAYQQRSAPFWQDALLATIQAGGKIGAAAIPH